MLYPDYTTFIQLAIFLVVFFAFSRVFFKPYLELLNARDEALGIDRSVDEHHGDESHDHDGDSAGAPDVPAWSVDNEPGHREPIAEQIQSLEERLLKQTNSLHQQATQLRDELLGQAQEEAASLSTAAAAEAAKTIADAQGQLDALKEEVWQSLAAQKTEFLDTIQNKILA